MIDLHTFLGESEQSGRPSKNTLRSKILATADVHELRDDGIFERLT